jgi:hypothetical protein
VEISVRGEEIVIRRLRSVRELKGIFRAYAKGKFSNWDTVREGTIRRVVREVASE